MYNHFTNNFEFLYPGPAETWVFTEEHPDSINDTAFFNPNPTFFDFPAVYHNGATVLAMADGHAEVHKWSGSLRTLPVKLPNGYLPVVSRPNDPDVHWMSCHAGRSSTNSY
jgi:prepilin-type processing-associated H-X9-DG protein